MANKIKPTIKSSSFTVSIQRAVVGGNTVAKVNANGLMRAVESVNR